MLAALRIVSGLFIVTFGFTWTVGQAGLETTNRNLCDLVRAVSIWPVENCHPANWIIWLWGIGALGALIFLIIDAARWILKRRSPRATSVGPIKWNQYLGPARTTNHISGLWLEGKSVSDKLVKLKDAFIESAITGDKMQMQMCGTDRSERFSPMDSNPIPPGAFVSLVADFSPSGMEIKPFLEKWRRVWFNAIYEGEPADRILFDEKAMEPYFPELGPRVTRKPASEKENHASRDLNKIGNQTKAKPSRPNMIYAFEVAFPQLEGSPLAWAKVPHLRWLPRADGGRDIISVFIEGKNVEEKELKLESAYIISGITGARLEMKIEVVDGRNVHWVSVTNAGPIPPQAKIKMLSAELNGDEGIEESQFAKYWGTFSFVAGFDGNERRKTYDRKTIDAALEEEKIDPPEPHVTLGKS